MTTQLAIGIDIGGTNMRAALVDRAGQILCHHRRRVALAGDAAAVAAEIIALVAAVGQESGHDPASLAGIGIGIPGWVDRWTGELVFAPKFAALDSRLLSDRLAAGLPCPVHFGCDPHVATLGELWAGAGRGAASFVMITLGTGIGCGIIIEGQLYRGHHGFAPEFGHMIVAEAGEIPCACGIPGCLESLASGPAIGRAGQRAAAEGRGPRLLERAGGRVAAISAETVVACATDGDATARSILERAGRLVGVACANVVSLLEPERIVVGGGLSEVGELLLGLMREEMGRKTYLIAQGYVAVPLVRAELGDRAGVVGAAKLAHDGMS